MKHRFYFSSLLLLLILIVSVLLFLHSFVNFDTWKQTGTHRRSKVTRKDSTTKFSLFLDSGIRSDENDEKQRYLLATTSAQKGTLCLSSLSNVSRCDVEIGKSSASTSPLVDLVLRHMKIFRNENDSSSRRQEHHHHHQQSASSLSSSSSYILQHREKFGDLRNVLTHYKLEHVLKKRDSAAASKVWNQYFSEQVDRDEKKLKKMKQKTEKQRAKRGGPHTERPFRLLHSPLSSTDLCSSFEYFAGFVVLHQNVRKHNNDYDYDDDDDNYEVDALDELDKHGGSRISSPQSITVSRILKNPLVQLLAPYSRKNESDSCTVYHDVVDVHDEKTMIGVYFVLADNNEEPQQDGENGDNNDDEVREQQLRRCLRRFDRRSIFSRRLTVFCPSGHAVSSVTQQKQFFFPPISSLGVLLRNLRSQNLTIQEDLTKRHEPVAKEQQKQHQFVGWFAIPNYFLVAERIFSPATTAADRGDPELSTDFFVDLLEQTIRTFSGSNQIVNLRQAHTQREQDFVDFLGERIRTVGGGTLGSVNKGKKSKQARSAPTTSEKRSRIAPLLSVRDWKKYFLKKNNNDMPRLVVTVATDVASPMICGLLSAANEQNLLNTKDSNTRFKNRVLFLFAPIGTSAQDQAEFERMMDLCSNGGSSSTIYLWHRNIVESDRAFPIWKEPFLLTVSASTSSTSALSSSDTKISLDRDHKRLQQQLQQQRGEANFQHFYVFDEREAKEASIQIAAAAVLGTVNHVAVADGADEAISSLREKSSPSSSSSSSRRFSSGARRFHQRNFVDPDFFVLNSTPFVLDPRTETILLLLHPAEGSKHVRATPSNGFYQESFFSRHRHPALKNQIQDINNIDWLKSEVYGLRPNESQHSSKFDRPVEKRLSPATSKNSISSPAVAATNKMIKLRRRMKKLGNLSTVRFGYRSEEMGFNGDMIDLRVVLVHYERNLHVRNLLQQFLREAKHDAEQRSVYLENKRRCSGDDGGERSKGKGSTVMTKVTTNRHSHDNKNCKSKQEMVSEIKSMMVRQQQEEIIKISRAQAEEETEEKEQKKGQVGELSSTERSINDYCFKKTVTPTAFSKQRFYKHFVFFHYPWVRDNLYHTFNDNVLPLFNGMRKAILAMTSASATAAAAFNNSSIQRSSSSSQTRNVSSFPRFICPFGVDLYLDDSSICLNNSTATASRNGFAFEATMVQLRSDRSNSPLPVFDFIFDHLFGKDNIIKLGANDRGDNNNDDASGNNGRSSAGKFFCFLQNETYLVWGRPARPFSATASDVAEYFFDHRSHQGDDDGNSNDADDDDDDDDDSTNSQQMTWSTLFYVRSFLKMIILPSYVPTVRLQNEKSQERSKIRIVYLERKSKRIFHSDLAMIAMLASYKDFSFRKTSQISSSSESQVEMKSDDDDTDIEIEVKTCCEGLSFEDQVKLIGVCDILVGVHGAALLHAIHVGLFPVRHAEEGAKGEKTKVFISPHHVPRPRPSPLVVHLASKRLNYHEQTVIERLVLMTSKAVQEEEASDREIRFVTETKKFEYAEKETTKKNINSVRSASNVRFMTTRTLVDGSKDPAQHWSDNFDLPAEEIKLIVDRIFERYFSLN